MNNWRYKFTFDLYVQDVRVCHALKQAWLNLPTGIKSATNQLRICYHGVKVGCVFKLHYALCGKKVGFHWARFCPAGECKKTKFTSTVRNSLNSWLIFSV